MDKKCSAPEENIPGTSQDKSKKSTKVLRTRKINWVPTMDKETYRTVVVNYHYTKDDKNRARRSTGAVPKRRNSWLKLLNQVTKRIKSNDDEEIPNLSSLYGESSTDVKPSTSCLRKMGRDLNHNQTDEDKAESKRDEACSLGTRVTLEQLQVPPKAEVVIQDIPGKLEEIIILSDDDDDEYTSDEGRVSEIENTNAKTTTHTQTQYMPDSCRYIPEINRRPMEKHQKNREPTPRELLAASLSCPLPRKCTADISSSCSTQKLKIKAHGTHSYKQRQLELHRLRIAVEQKRLDLLELKLARERDEMVREQILFEKELDFKTSQIKQLADDRDF